MLPSKIRYLDRQHPSTFRDLQNNVTHLVTTHSNESRAPRITSAHEKHQGRMKTRRQPHSENPTCLRPMPTDSQASSPSNLCSTSSWTNRRRLETPQLSRGTHRLNQAATKSMS